MKAAISRLLLLTAGSVLLMWAADFWHSKPFTEWNEKECAKMLTDSPWAHKISVEMGGSLPAAVGGHMGRRGRGGGGASSGPATGAMGGDPSRPDSMAAPGADPMGDSGAAPSVTLVVLWQSALPVREAQVKARFGAEAGTAPQGKQFLEQRMTHYVVGIVNVPAMLVRAERGRGEEARDKEGGPGDAARQLKEAFLRDTSLRRKGKDNVAPDDIQVTPRGNTVEIYFLFPKSAAIAMEDKEVEFVSKIRNQTIRQRFRLKDMVVGDQLAL